jgi:hypothetical protein
MSIVVVRCLLFFNKGRSTACHIKRRSSFTSQAEANTTTHNNAHEQRTRQDATPPPPGRRTKGAVATRAVDQRCATTEAATRCKVKQATRAPPPWAITDRLDTPGCRSLNPDTASAENSRRSANAKHRPWPLYVGASPHPPPHSSATGSYT